MATYTPNYGLHQWVPEDEFHRTDFNEDFAKLDSALMEHIAEMGRIEQRLLGFLQNFGNYAHMFFTKAMTDFCGPKMYTPLRSVFLETFDTSDNIASLGGRLALQVGTLVLPWNAEPATMTTVPIDLSGIPWSHAVAWLRCSPNVTYSMKINGIPAVQVGSWASKSESGEGCIELQMEADVPDGGDATLAITLTAFEQYVPRIYEYGVLFL